jgi:DNA-binding NarL/FixJ family response regulator
MEDVLVAAIRQVADGKRFIDYTITEQMMYAASTPMAHILPHERLSERELHVLKLFAQGMGVGEIANQLFISHKTVSTHKARLMQKMHISTNAELVRYVADHGLIV